ncbi:hypothetical protein V8E36_000048 [Tilletia maclaganii]
MGSSYEAQPAPASTLRAVQGIAIDHLRHRPRSSDRRATSSPVLFPELTRAVAGTEPRGRLCARFFGPLPPPGLPSAAIAHIATRRPSGTYGLAKVGPGAMLSWNQGRDLLASMAFSGPGSQHPGRGLPLFAHSRRGCLHSDSILCGVNPVEYTVSTTIPPFQAAIVIIMTPLLAVSLALPLAKIVRHHRCHMLSSAHSSSASWSRTKVAS